MKPLTLTEVLPLADYERVRPRLRPLFMTEKDRRRLPVGEHLTFLFENGQTLWYQVHEILRSEAVSTEQAIQHELDTYNELLPAPGELSATLLIEYREPSERDTALRAIVGLERHLWLVLGEKRHGARFDASQISSDQISAVQFIRFPAGGIGQEEFIRLASAGKVAIEADHPHLAARAPIKDALASALAEDLRED
ncbi:MAG: DUF3501 family protein [Candidatus Binataceae bacterium]